MNVVESKQTTTATQTVPTTSGGPRGGLTSMVGKNTVYGIVASLFQVGTRLVTVPIIIYHMGLGGYGIWSIIMTAAVYMRFGSVGIKSAFQKYVAEATGDGDYDKASALLSTGTAAMMIVSFALLIPVVFFSRQLAVAAGIPPEFLRDTSWAFSVLALTMLFANSGAAYEAIVLGGHRIDVARRINSILSVAEAIAIVAFLHIGWGLFAMASVMAASELIYLVCCYAVAHRVVPQIHVAARFVTKKVLRELLRFAGSYQVLSVLQLTYQAIGPIVILRAFGADSAGVFAVATRLAQPVMMAHNAFLLPILSGSAMVFASGDSDRLQRLLTKSFKVTLALTLLPLALLSVFGTYIVQAWTGQTNASFHYAIWLVSLALLFQTFCQLGLVLYRATGGAVMDNVREVIRLAAFVPVLFMTHRYGFEGVLLWMAGSEFAGMIVMFFAVDKSFRVSDAKSLVPDTLRLTAATAGIVAFAALAARVIPELALSARMLATIRIGVVGVATLVAAYPALYLTGSISGAEVQSILGVFRRRVGAGAPSVQ
jgi:O-antigen/teichoic acid export membrane protein